MSWFTEVNKASYCMHKQWVNWVVALVIKCFLLRSGICGFQQMKLLFNSKNLNKIRVIGKRKQMFTDQRWWKIKKYIYPLAVSLYVSCTNFLKFWNVTETFHVFFLSLASNIVQQIPVKLTSRSTWASLTSQSSTSRASGLIFKRKKTNILIRHEKKCVSRFCFKLQTKNFLRTKSIASKICKYMTQFPITIHLSWLSQTP